MGTIKLGIIVGSLSSKSINMSLTRAMEKVRPQGLEFDFIDIKDLPMYNQDIENPLPAPVTAFKAQVKAADVLMFVTPEYNRSIPGCLKNAIDWGTRPYGDNAFAGKTAGIIGTSPGAIGTAVAQAHLRSVLPFLGMTIMGQPEMYIAFKDGMISEDGTFADPATAKFFASYLEKLAARIIKTS